MTIKIGINGMGRIGRMVLRSIIENDNKKFEIKHINNRTGPEACSALIKYDSIHGRLNAEIKFDDNHIVINDKKISFSQETKLEKINLPHFSLALKEDKIFFYGTLWKIYFQLHHSS